MGRIVTLAELSEIVGRSERVLIEYTDDGMPCHERGGEGRASAYDTAQVVAWMVGQATARRDASTEAERRRLLSAQATRAELELKARAGDLVDVRQFSAGARRAATELRESLLAIPARIAQVLDPANPNKARALLERELQQSLSGISQYLDTLPESGEAKDGRRG